MIVAGGATNIIRESNASSLALKEYSVNLTRLVRPIDDLKKKNSRVLWALQEPINKDKINDVHDPLTNELIDKYNKAAIDVSIIQQLDAKHALNYIFCLGIDIFIGRTMVELKVDCTGVVR